MLDSDCSQSCFVFFTTVEKQSKQFIINIISFASYTADSASEVPQLVCMVIFLQDVDSHRKRVE